MTTHVSEQVSAGHPDKIADQISDALLTEYLRQDKDSRCAIETAVKNDNVMVFGEVSSRGILTDEDIKSIVEGILEKRCPSIGDVSLSNMLDRQSPDIAQGVDVGGAGDQGIMVGYATVEGRRLLPIAYELATDVLIEMDNLNRDWYPRHLRRELDVDYDGFNILGPDRKAQVVLSPNTTTPYEVVNLLLSTQHTEEATDRTISSLVRVAWDRALSYHEGIVDLPEQDDIFLINPTGRFVIGGPIGDAGLTGRKVIADTYGSASSHGGGAFSGKDPSKVDRSAAYMARFVAKSIVEQGMLPEVTVKVAYAIGVPRPVYLELYTPDKTNWMNIEIAEDFVNSFDWRPAAITEFLGLKDVDYNKTSVYGHFTDQTLPWEVIQ